MNYLEVLFNKVRLLRCHYRLHHDWEKPIVSKQDGRTHISHTCKRCGKHVERTL